MRLLIPTLLLLLAQLCAAQQQPPRDSVRIANPSFEDTPRASASPAGWSTGTPGSTPDIMPGAWGVQCPPLDGKSCLALVTREDGTVEDVGQRLDVTLKKDSCYTFSLFLAHSTQYVGYNLPVRLRIWGGATPGQKTVLLAGTPLISHTEWKAYKLQFVPTADILSITLEAYYAPGTLFKYRGNILLDYCSAIRRCNRA
jgi:hypothetical protein